MKNLVIIFSVCCAFYLLAGQTLSDLQNSEDWDLELLEFDLNTQSEPRQGMMTMGAFPVMRYQGSGGVSSHHFSVGDAAFAGSSFFIGKNDHNNQLYEGEDVQRSFFTILTQVDASYDSDQTASSILSRNHPDYVGQGCLKTHGLSVEYLAFSEGDDPAHALVNMKLFDLAEGNTILLAPQADGSFRVKQVDLGYMSLKESQKKVSNLLAEPTTVSFFGIASGEVKRVGVQKDTSDYEKKRIEVVFHKGLRRMDLDRIKAEMAQQDITVTYHNLEFSRRGKLKEISFTVKTNDGYEGSSSSKLLGLAPVGFMRDFSEDAKISFSVGTLK